MHSQKSIYEELKPFANMIIDQGRGVTVSDLAFASAEDRYSTGYIPFGTIANTVLPANSTVKLFQTNIGQAGQGTALQLTRSETNNTNGDRQPSNQVYIATHLGFQVYAINQTNLTPIPFTKPQQVLAIGLATVWNLTVGDGIKRTLGTVLEYPAGSGVDWFGSSGSSVSYIGNANNGWVGCAKRKLPIPIVFPPNVQVDIELATGTATQVVNQTNANSIVSGAAPFTGGSVAYRATFRGFRMTLPA